MGQIDGNLAASNSSSMPGLDWLWSLKPWKGVGAFGLEGITKAANLFGDPQEKFRSIHVAGTNGKGSVVSFLGSALREAGVKTGVTISPHLSRVNERISINGEEISNGELNHILEEIKATIDEHEITLSFFESVILASFIHFARSGVEVAVVEVGLGGRLDATNIISRPDASVITSIGLDHQRILGETEEEIAGEKAGIIKQGRPVFVGAVGDKAFGEIEAIASSNSSPCYRFGRDFVVNESLKPGLVGEHQLKNASLAAEVLKHLGVEESAIERGISKAFWPGRLETIRVGEVEFLLDCAHNLEGAEALARYLSQAEFPPMPLVTGFLNTKNWPQIVDIIDEFTDRYFLLRPEANQAEDLKEVAAYIQGKGKLSSVHDDNYNGVITTLCGSEYTGKRVLVMGSIYLVSRFRELLIERSS